jgi:hypothetical protein
MEGDKGDGSGKHFVQWNHKKKLSPIKLHLTMFDIALLEGSYPL